jgi:hypothetical protein
MTATTPAAAAGPPDAPSSPSPSPSPSPDRPDGQSWGIVEWGAFVERLSVQTNGFWQSLL